MVQERRGEIFLWLVNILGLIVFIWSSRQELILAMYVGQLIGWLVSKDNRDPNAKRMAHLTGAAIGFTAYVTLSLLGNPGR